MQWITVKEAAKIARRHPITIRQHIGRMKEGEHTKKEGGTRYISREYVVKTFVQGAETDRVNLSTVKDEDLERAMGEHIATLKEQLAFHVKQNSQLLAELAEQRQQTARLIEQVDDLTAMTVRLGLKLGAGPKLLD